MQKAFTLSNCSMRPAAGWSATAVRPSVGEGARDIVVTDLCCMLFLCPHTETARIPRARGAGGAGTGPRETGGPPRTACRAGMIKGNSVRARTGAPLFIIAYPDGYWF